MKNYSPRSVITVSALCVVCLGSGMIIAGDNYAEKGMVVDLDSVTPAAGVRPEDDGGMEIPLSMEMFETVGDGVDVTLGSTEPQVVLDQPVVLKQSATGATAANQPATQAQDDGVLIPLSIDMFEASEDGVDVTLGSAEPQVLLEPVVLKQLATGSTAANPPATQAQDDGVLIPLSIDMFEASEVGTDVTLGSADAQVLLDDQVLVRQSTAKSSTLNQSKAQAQDDGVLIPLSMEMFESIGNDKGTGVTLPEGPGTDVQLKEISTTTIPGPTKETGSTEINPQILPLPLPVKMVEASGATQPVEESVSDEVFNAVVDAMKPEEPPAPLKENRFTFYMSDAVAFAQIEGSTERMKLDRGRLHLASLYSEERDSVVHGGLALDSTFTQSFRLSFGGRAYIALMGEENVDAFAAAIGAEAAYRLPIKKAPLEFATSLYYAPDILTFGAGDRAFDARFDFILPFRAKSALFAGWRFLQVDVRPEDREIDNRFHLGFHWDFN